VGDPQLQSLFQATSSKIYHDFKNRGNPYLIPKNQTLSMTRIDVGLKNNLFKLSWAQKL
jgi:hypothetical protein